MNLFDLVATLSIDTSAYDKSLSQSGKKMSDYKSDVMKLAQTYKKQGVSMADAMKKAYSEIDKSQYETETTSEKTSKGFFKNWDSSKIKSVASKLGSGVKRIASTVTKVIAVAVTAASAAVVGFGKSAVTAGSQFDTSMSQVAATMGKSTDEIKDLREFAKKMGSETAFSASQAADALNYMALAGYDSKTSMSMLPNVLNLAAAGSIDLAEASDMVTDAQSALGLSLDDTSKLVDKMAKASSKTNTSVAQLGEAILTVGGTAKNLKGGTTELLAALGLLADNGVKGAEGGTALRNIILSLSAPTDSAAKAIKALGVEVFDEQGNMRDLESIFTDLNASLSTMSQGKQTQALNKIFNKVDLKSVNALLGTSIGRWDEVTKGIDNATGSAQKMADTQLDNLAGDITKFKSALEGAQIAASEKLTPTLRKFVQFGTKGISNLATAFKKDGVEGLIAALGEILSQGMELILSKIPNIVKVLIDVWGKTVLTSTDTFFKLFVEVVNEVIKLIPNILPQIIGVLKNLAELILNNIDEIINTAINIIDIVSDTLIDSLPVLTEAVLTIIEKLIDYITDPKNLAKIVEMAAKVIINVATALMAAAPKLLVGVGKIIAAVIDNIVSTDWSELGQQLMNNITAALQSASTKLSVWWDGWSQQISKYAVIAWRSVVKTWSGVGKWFGDRWNDIKTAFSNVGKWFAETFSNAWTKITKVFAPVGETFNKIGNSILDGVKSLINGLIIGINSIISVPFQGLNDALNGIKGIDIFGTKPFEWINLIDIPQIPYLSRGGVLKKGQIGFLEGDGDEAVVPLSQNTEWIDKIAAKLNNRTESSNRPIQFSLNIENFINNTDDDLEKIVDKLMEMISERTNRRDVIYA